VSFAFVGDAAARGRVELKIERLVCEEWVSLLPEAPDSYIFTWWQCNPCVHRRVGSADPSSQARQTHKLVNVK
jgi:hypothetical protein